MRRRSVITLTEDHKRIIWALRTHGPMSRTALAARLGLHNGAMTRLARELMTLDLIDEGEAEPAARGRPTVPMVISGRGGYAAGATVHPGWLEIALVDFSGALIARDIEPFDDPDPRPFIKAVERRLAGLGMGHMLRSRFLGLGVAATGPTKREDPSRRLAVPWLSGWRDQDLTELFSDYLGVPVWVENDATLAALAEFYDERLIGVASSALVFFIGHGVGGGLIVDRQLFAGQHGNAGEIGRLFPGPPTHRPSGIDLLSRLQEAGAQVHSLLDMDSALAAHPAVVAAWIDRAGGQLATAIDSGVAWLDPGAVVMSGALPFEILQRLADRVEQGAWATDFDFLARPQLHVSRLGSLAVAKGAALLPIHHVGA